jgi:hypothetical protein
MVEYDYQPHLNAYGFPCKNGNQMNSFREAWERMFALLKGDADRGSSRRN